MNWDEEYRRLKIEFDALERKLTSYAALNAELSEKVRQLTKLLDDQNGTPCEQIRHAEEKAELIAALEKIVELAHYPDESIARAAIAKAKE